MSKLFAKISELFAKRTFVGRDKTGNRYFTRTEEIDGVLKEKRWVVFKGEDDPTSIPVEWICWLNGQRKKAPTPEEMIELEARRELVRKNVALLKKEEEERRAKEGRPRKVISAGKVGGPDLKSFVQQFPSTSEGARLKNESDATERTRDTKVELDDSEKEPLPTSSEPTGSGATFKPGTWQPPT